MTVIALLTQTEVAVDLVIRMLRQDWLILENGILQQSFISEWREIQWIMKKIWIVLLQIQYQRLS